MITLGQPGQCKTICLCQGQLISNFTSSLPCSITSSKAPRIRTWTSLRHSITLPSLHPIWTLTLPIPLPWYLAHHGYYLSFLGMCLPPSDEVKTLRLCFTVSQLKIVDNGNIQCPPIIPFSALCSLGCSWFTDISDIAEKCVFLRITTHFLLFINTVVISESPLPWNNPHLVYTSVLK